jgi:hypothetical protein
MWPFNLIRKRQYDRSYKTALIVFLGAYQFSRLNVEQKGRVEAEMNADLIRSGSVAAFWKKNMPWYHIAAFRAAAMDRIGLPVAISHVTWVQVFRPWALWTKLPQWRPKCDPRPFVALLEFRPMDQATKDAEAFLSRSGVDVSTLQPPFDLKRSAI